jgi:hypothetical protein
MPMAQEARKIIEAVMGTLEVFIWDFISCNWSDLQDWDQCKQHRFWIYLLSVD